MYSAVQKLQNVDLMLICWHFVVCVCAVRRATVLRTCTSTWCYGVTRGVCWSRSVWRISAVSRRSWASSWLAGWPVSAHVLLVLLTLSLPLNASITTSCGLFLFSLLAHHSKTDAVEQVCTCPRCVNYKSLWLQYVVYTAVFPVVTSCLYLSTFSNNITCIQVKRNSNYL